MSNRQPQAPRCSGGLFEPVNCDYKNNKRTATLAQTHLTAYPEMGWPHPQASQRSARNGVRTDPVGTTVSRTTARVKDRSPWRSHPVFSRLALRLCQASLVGTGCCTCSKHFLKNFLGRAQPSVDNCSPTLAPRKANLAACCSLSPSDHAGLQIGRRVGSAGGNPLARRALFSGGQ